MNLQPCLIFASERLSSLVVWEMDCFVEAACLIVCNPARRRSPQARVYGGSRSSLSDSSEGERSSKKGEDVGAKAPSFQVFDSRWSCVLSSSPQRRAVLCVHVMRAKLVAEGKHFWALVPLFLISITMTTPPAPHPAAFYFVGTSLEELVKCLLGVGLGTRKWTWVCVHEEASPIRRLLWLVSLGKANSGYAFPSSVSPVDIQDYPSDLLYDRC